MRRKAIQQGECAELKTSNKVLQAGRSQRNRTMSWRNDFTLTSKERENLMAWEEWGNKMKMLRAIHQEIAQKKAALSGNDL